MTSLFCPDVDWNDAMWAVDRLGKLVEVNLLPRGYVRVNIYPDGDEFEMVVAGNVCGPTAMCKAILKLKGAP